MVNRTGNRAATNNAAYQRTIRLEIREITRRLNAAVGGALVAALAGSKDTKASHKWAKEDGSEPRPEAAKHLAFAYEHWLKIAEAKGNASPGSGLSAPTPGSNTTPPVNAIREGYLKEVSIAAQALIDDSFNG